ncbi:MAG TPA: hypothetical protein VGX75_00975 [bacterium]|nr:hypothetical protein [bacterium]
MIRRLTIACGLLTLAVVAVLALQGHTLFGARSSHRGPTQVTAIPDRPAFWPPVKPVPSGPPPLRGLPPSPQPQPLHHAPVQSPPAAGSARTTISQVATALLNLPKILSRALTQPSDDH